MTSTDLYRQNKYSFRSNSWLTKLTAVNRTLSFKPSSNDLLLFSKDVNPRVQIYNIHTTLFYIVNKH